MDNNMSGMNACLAVERDVNRIINKFGDIGADFNKGLSDLMSYIESLKCDFQNTSEGEELSPAQYDSLKNAMAKVKQKLTRLTSDHRELHAAVSKVGKDIDRNFIVDFSIFNKDEVSANAQKSTLLNQVIYQHYCREGMYDVASTLAKDSGIKEETHNEQAFTELNHILECLKARDVEPALAWASVNRDLLLANYSTLEFKLHRLKFIEKLRKGSTYQTDAIAYARMHFAPFVHNHQKEIQTLMGMLLFVQNGIDTSPYSEVLDNEMWLEIYEQFNRDACKLLGVVEESALTTCVNAGCTAIPALLNIKNMMKDKQVNSIWSARDELPVEIDLGSEKRYHSMFACPILKQQSTSNNPPMRLVCGHVISKEALHKLTQSGNKLKCPYCPMEQNPSDARILFF